MFYSVNYFFGVVLFVQGLFWGGVYGVDVGVVVSVDNVLDLDLCGVVVEVCVGNNCCQIFGFGQCCLLLLGGYQCYCVDVQDFSVYDSEVVVCVVWLGVVQYVFLLLGKVIVLLIGLEVIYIFIGNVCDIVGVLLDGVCIFNVLVLLLGSDGGFIVEFLQCELVFYLLQVECLLQCLLIVCECCSVVLLVGDVQCELLVLECLLVLICYQVCVQWLLNELVLVVCWIDGNVMGEV